MPKFQPGNPGRPKGSKNKVPKDLRSNIRKFVEYNLESIQAEYDKIKNPLDKLNYLEKMLQFVLPKLSHSKIDLDQRIDSLDDHQLDDLIQKLLDETTEYEN